MKKIVMSILAVAALATSSMAIEKVVGEITYVQVRPDGQIAVKVLPTGGSTEVYHVIPNTDAKKMKAAYAMVLTALSTGKNVEAWTNDAGYWDTFFLRK